MFDLVIRNGIITTHESTFSADIAITGEKIVEISSPGCDYSAKRVYDAEGKFILPGLIDPHVHMAHPFQGELSADGFESTSTSAAFGGVTTILDFAIQWDKSKLLTEVIEERIKAITGKCNVDFGLHAVPTKSTEESIIAVNSAKKYGVNTFKVYMVYRQQGRMVDDAILSGLLDEIRKVGGRLLVHAENVSMAEFNQEKFISKGLTSSDYFPLYKPNIVEAEAVNRVLFLNRMAKSKLYIVHLSTKEGLESLKYAQDFGDNAIAETCTQYLTLNKEVYTRPDGHHFICSPPLRSNEDIEALWGGIAKGYISIVSSDHCGFDIRQKNLGNGDFTKTPNGIPGIEARLPVLYTEGVLKNRIDLNQLVALTSTNPAKVFNLFPQKGSIMPGSDADLVILDTENEIVLDPSKLHDATDWSPYSGMKLKGFSKATILRGQFLIDNGVYVGGKGYGKYLNRN